MQVKFKKIIFLFKKTLNLIYMENLNNKRYALVALWHL